MDKRKEKAFLRHALESYTNFDYPDFTFAMRNLDSDKHNKLREALCQYQFTGETDLNYDICETFINKKEGLYVNISLVGPFFFLPTEKWRYPQRGTRERGWSAMCSTPSQTQNFTL